MSAMRAKIPCQKCGNPETEVVAAQVHLGPDDEGQRVHQQTIYTLRCSRPDCQHAFETTVPAETQVL
jgi:hypothetical protein